MQFAAYLIVCGEKIKVLARDTKTYRALKLRKTGEDGSLHLSESSSIRTLKFLKDGQVIKC